MNCGPKPGVLWQWLPIAVASTVLAFAGAFTSQQQLRAGADQPQSVLVHDAAEAMAAGQDRGAWMPAPITLESGQGMFLAAYDAAGKPLWSSARLAGRLPEPPPGVFRNANRGQYRVTWQPRPTIRQALVIVPNPRRGRRCRVGGHSRWTP